MSILIYHQEHRSGTLYLDGYFFGTSYLKRRIYCSLKIPNLLRTLFGEGALSTHSTLIIRDRAEKGTPAAFEFALQVLSISLYADDTHIFGSVLAPLIVKCSIRIGPEASVAVSSPESCFPICS